MSAATIEHALAPNGAIAFRLRRLGYVGEVLIPGPDALRLVSGEDLEVDSELGAIYLLHQGSDLEIIADDEEGEKRLHARLPIAALRPSEA